MTRSLRWYDYITVNIYFLGLPRSRRPTPWSFRCSSSGSSASRSRVPTWAACACGR